MEDKRKKETVIIGGYSSRCGACGRGASPSEGSHKTIVEYSPDTGKPGCGQVWKYMSNEYAGQEESLKRQWPNLEYIDAIYSH